MRTKVRSSGILALLVLGLRTAVAPPTIRSQQPGPPTRPHCGVSRRGDTVDVCASATDSDMARLDGMTGIRVIGLGLSMIGYPPAIHDAGFAHLANLHELEEIKLPGDHLTDAALASLSGLSELRVLKMYGTTNFTSAGLAHLAPLTNLRSLTLWDTLITDLRPLRGAAALTNLTLYQSRVTDAGLAGIATSFPHLVVLDLDGLNVPRSRITNAGLAHLASLTNLRSLTLDDTLITDLRPLRGASALTDLALQQSRVTDAGLAGIATSFPHLVSLNLDGSRITDAGLARLEGLVHLTTLSVTGTRVTDVGKIALNTVRPEFSISGR